MSREGEDLQPAWNSFGWKLCSARQDEGARPVCALQMRTGACALVPRSSRPLLWWAGARSSQPFLLVRLSKHGLRRNYIVSGAVITSEQAVLFTLGYSAASSFYLGFDFTSYLLKHTAQDKSPLCVALSFSSPPGARSLPPPNPDTLWAETSRPQK